MRGVALILTTRQAAPPGVPSITVQALTLGETAELIHKELGPGVPAEVVHWVQRRAAGNPLFTLEYVRYLARSGHLYSDGQRWHWRVPDDDLVPGRVEALIELVIGQAGACRGTLEARAVLPEADETGWAALAEVPRDELQRQRRILEDLALLTEGRFTHPLYPEVLRANLSAQQRQELAGRALRLYQAEPLRTVTFLPWARLPPGQEAEILRAAAAEAGRTGQAQRRGLLLAQASDLSSGPVQAELALQAAEALQVSQLPRALELAQRSLSEPSLRERALPIAAVISARIGGKEVMETLLVGQALGWPTSAARLQGLQAIGDHAAVLACWEGLSAGERAQADVSVQYVVTVALIAVGRTSEAERHLNTLFATPITTAERLRLQGAQVMLLYHQGQYREAARTALGTAAQLRDAGHLVTASALNHNAAAFLRMAGEFGAALDSVGLALEARRALGDVRGYASSLALLGELELERGHLDAAEDALTQALETLNHLDNTHFLLNTVSMLSALYVQSDAPMSAALAQLHARRALELARTLGNARLLVETLGDASRAQTRAGDPATGLHLADEATAQAAALDADTRTVVRNHLARGLALEGLGRLDEARSALQQAETLARVQQSAYEESRVQLELARLGGDRGRLEELVRHFEAHGQGLGALLARRALGNARETVTPRLPLQVLGPLQLAGQPVRGERRRALLLRLLNAQLSGRSEVGRLDLIDDLYPDKAEEPALGALRQVVAELRSIYGRSVVVTTTAGYALGTVQSDAERFLDSADITLWRGALPAELGEPTREALLHALRQCAQACWPHDPEGTAHAGRLLLEHDPLDEAAFRLTLEALRAQRQHRSLGRLYATGRAGHAEVGLKLPERWQDYLRPLES